jgi:hypothetical protein
MRVPAARTLCMRPIRNNALGCASHIDSIVPMREEDGEGSGKDCMRQFRTAWDRFSADPARLSEFLETERKRLR